MQENFTVICLCVFWISQLVVQTTSRWKKLMGFIKILTDILKSIMWCVLVHVTIVLAEFVIQLVGFTYGHGNTALFIKMISPWSIFSEISTPPKISVTGTKFRHPGLATETLACCLYTCRKFYRIVAAGDIVFPFYLPNFRGTYIGKKKKKPALCDLKVDNTFRRGFVRSLFCDIPFFSNHIFETEWGKIVII